MCHGRALAIGSSRVTVTAEAQAQWSASGVLQNAPRYLVTKKAVKPTCLGNGEGTFLVLAPHPVPFLYSQIMPE